MILLLHQGIVLAAALLLHQGSLLILALLLHRRSTQPPEQSPAKTSPQFCTHFAPTSPRAPLGDYLQELHGDAEGKKTHFFEKKCGESTFLLVLHPERSWGEPGAAGGCSLGGSACCGLFPAYFTAASARFCLPLGLREAPEGAKQLPPPRSCDFGIPAKRRPQISLPAPSGAGSFLHPTPCS